MPNTNGVSAGNCRRQCVFPQTTITGTITVTIPSPGLSTITKFRHKRSHSYSQTRGEESENRTECCKVFHVFHRIDFSNLPCYFGAEQRNLCDGEGRQGSRNTIGLWILPNFEPYHDATDTTSTSQQPAAAEREATQGAS